jgi:hypothetical protein
MDSEEHANNTALEVEMQEKVKDAKEGLDDGITSNDTSLNS